MIHISEGTLVLLVALGLYLLACVWFEITEAFHRWKERRKKE